MWGENFKIAVQFIEKQPMISFSLHIILQRKTQTKKVYSSCILKACYIFHYGQTFYNIA